MYLLSGRDSLPLSPNKSSLLVGKKDREENVFRAPCLKVWKASEGDLDLGRLRSVVIRSGFCKKKQKNQKKPPENTHTSSHGSPLPPAFLCKFGHDYKWEKPRGVWLHGGDGRYRVECAFLCMQSFACKCVWEKKIPMHTQIHTHTCTSATQNRQSQQHEIPSRFNMHSCTNGMTRKASKPLFLRWKTSCKYFNNGILLV